MVGHGEELVVGGVREGRMGIMATIGGRRTTVEGTGS